MHAIPGGVGAMSARVPPGQAEVLFRAAAAAVKRWLSSDVAAQRREP